mgnify:CR=1 FL=1
MNSVQQPKPAVSTDITAGQDQLLAAGSKISFRDIYNQEIDIPLYKGKYYRAEDVDGVFVMINGVLMDVSKHAHRSSKALTLSREETQDAKSKLAKTEEALGAAKKQNETLEAHLNTLIQKVSDYSLAASEDNLDNEYVNQLETEVETLRKDKSELEVEYSNLQSDYDASQSSIESLQSQLSELTSQLNDQQEAYTRLLEDVSNTADAKALADELAYANESISQLNTENEDLVNHNNQLSQTLNKVKQSYKQLQLSYQQLIKDNELLTQRVEMLKKMNTM